MKTFNKIKKFFIFILICGFLCVIENAYAAGSEDNPEKKKGTVIFKPVPKEPKAVAELHAEDAQSYRAQGLEAQKRGDLDTALKFYQKGIELDPNYAILYNDLAVIYEARGEFNRAEEYYHKAIKVDPLYLSPYSNLALMYENKRDFKTAASYWQKRAELGSVDDSWTAKARSRYNAICLTAGNMPLETREQEIISFADEVAEQKTLLKKNNTELANYYFQKARTSFRKGDDVVALKEAINARQLDSSNKNIEEFVEKLQKRLLSK